MATLSLNIYKDNEIEKTYEAESYDLMLGTVEDIMQIIDIDKINDEMAVAGMIVRCYKQLTPFLKDIFDGLSDEELRRVKVKELIPLFKAIFTQIIDDLGLIKSGN